MTRRAICTRIAVATVALAALSCEGVGKIVKQEADQMYDEAIEPPTPQYWVKWLSDCGATKYLEQTYGNQQTRQYEGGTTSCSYEFFARNTHSNMNIVPYVLEWELADGAEVGLEWNRWKTLEPGEEIDVPGNVTDNPADPDRKGPSIRRVLSIAGVYDIPECMGHEPDNITVSMLSTKTEPPCVAPAGFDRPQSWQTH